MSLKIFNFVYQSLVTVSTFYLAGDETAVCEMCEDITFITIEGTNEQRGTRWKVNSYYIMTQIKLTLCIIILLK